MIVQDSWWSNGSAHSTIIDYHVPFDQGLTTTVTGPAWPQHAMGLDPSLHGTIRLQVMIGNLDHVLGEDR